MKSGKKWAIRTLNWRWPTAFGVLLLINLAALPGTATAHILTENHGISGVLHIPPDDNPVAGRPTRLDLTFGDQRQRFASADCICSLRITRDGETIPAGELTAGGATGEAAATVTFPQIGLYSATVTGTSKSGRFENFRLDYVVRVASSADGQATGSQDAASVIYIGLASFAILGMAAYRGIRDKPVARPR